MKQRTYLRTSELAKAVGMHPNTVRRYVDWGLLPPVERSASNYRLFTRYHLHCLRVAHLIYGREYPGRTIQQSAVRIIHCMVQGDRHGALAAAQAHLALVLDKQSQADAAADLLEHWAVTQAHTSQGPWLQIGQAAEALGVTIDVLRNWDRNGLIDVPRNTYNGYRRYGTREMARLQVIRMLSNAGYSIAAILRMMLQLDEGRTENLRQVLDTPRPDEDVYMASDRWISTLNHQEQKAHELIALVQEIIVDETRQAS